MATKLLGFNIYNKSKKELVDEIIKRDEKIHIISGNPEVLSNGLKNPLLLKNFSSEGSVIIPDGVGVVISSKIINEPVKEKIAGIELMGEILQICESTGRGIYLLGAKDEILKLCIGNLSKKYPGLLIVGSHDGYFDINNCEELLQDINKTKSYAIFVAMGAPRQEIFIANYMDRLDCTVFMGVGGSFDIYAEKVKRAPVWMIKSGLEWLYRVSKEPFRIKRLPVIPKFILKVFSNKYIIKGRL